MGEGFEGGCCWFVRYRTSSRPLFVHCRRFSWCQRETGSAFAVDALIESERVECLSGKAERIATPRASGKGQVVMRCPHCRIALWSHYSGAGEMIGFIRVGRLDELASLPLDIRIFTSTRLPRVELPSDTPVVEEYYQRSRYWPSQSIERRQAMLARQGG